MGMTPSVARTDRLAYRMSAERARVAADRVRPLHPSTRVVRVLVDDLWVETVLDGAWVAARRLVAQPTGLAVAEIRIFPLSGRTQPGQWTGDLLGTQASAPLGGITTRLLRRVRLDARESLVQVARQRGRHATHALTRAGVRSVRAARRTVGRPRLSEDVCVRAAREYVRLRAQRRRPGRLYNVLAARLGITLGQAIGRVARARQMGLLRDVPIRPDRRR